MRARGRYATQAAGFTLVELLVVLAVIGLLMAIVPQVTAGLPRFRLQAASANLSDRLRQLRDDSIRTGRTTSLSMDAEHRRYQATGIVGWLALPPIVERLQLLRNAPLGISGGEQLSFFADGSATGGIIKLGHGTYEETISVDWLTGRIRND